MGNSLKNKQLQIDEKKVYFISDAHLALDFTQNEHRLIEFFNQIKDDVGHLYILGDLFDFWFEYKHAVPAGYLRLLSSLLSLSDNGTKITFLPGNHDFWIGDFLDKQIGITLAGEYLDIEHQGRKIHLTHGDGLAYRDYGYRILKKIFRFRPNIWLYKILPVDLAYRLAHRTAGASREYTSWKSKDMQGYYDYAENKIKDGFDAVIMGHTHIPEVKKIQNGLYINSGDWIEHYSYVVLEEGEFELRYFK